MAWWVVFGHAIHLAGAPTWLSQKVTNILVQGDVAVNVFIILSGFVITHLLLTKHERYLPYITRRFFRVFPVYVFCLILALVSIEAYKFAYIELPYAEHASMRLERIMETNANFGWHLAAHLTMLHGVIPNNVMPYAGTSILAPAWSLSLEWQFYLLAPLLVGLMSRRLRSYIVVCMVLAFIYVVAKIFLDQYYQYSEFIAIALPFFVLGISSRLVLNHFNAWTAIGLLLMIFAASFKWKIESLIWLVWCFFMLNECGAFKEKQMQVISFFQRMIGGNSVLSALGTWSYSTYLVHIPVFSVCVHFLVGSQFLNEDPSRLNVQLAVLGAIVLLAPISWLMYKFIEKPGIRLGAKLAARF
jgi:peptidoglycan/LPS O-acetylase OafA/YrhL